MKTKCAECSHEYEHKEGELPEGVLDHIKEKHPEKYLEVKESIGGIEEKSN